MKIVCISDTHCLEQGIVLPDGDMLIHAGDLTTTGTLEQINAAFAWLGDLPFKHKVVIAGNHDFGLETELSGIVIPAGITYLKNNWVEIAGLKIWGSPICVPFADWAFMWDLERRQELYQTIPPDIDVIISHGPPWGILDKMQEGFSVGCTALAKRIKEIMPKLCIFGHIHYSYGLHQHDGITYVNAAILNQQYALANAPIVIEI